MIGRALQDSMDLSLAWPISDNNWTEWSTIQGLIARVIERLSLTLRQTVNGKNETFAVCL